MSQILHTILHSTGTLSRESDTWAEFSRAFLAIAHIYVLIVNIYMILQKWIGLYIVLFLRSSIGRVVKGTRNCPTHEGEVDGE